LSFWGDEPERRRTPKQLLRRLVWERDNGVCQICGKKVGQFDWELAHDKAHAKGGKLTLRNTFVAHSSCNSSQGTLSLRQTRRAIGITTPEDNLKKELKRLTVSQLRRLAAKSGIKVHGTVSEGFFETTRVAPSKTKFVNALARKVNLKAVQAAGSFKPEPKKKRRRRQTGLFGW
jgi:hypothetical protein